MRPLALVLLLAVPASAADVLYGGWKAPELHPRLGFSESYDDNIFRAPPGRESSSWIHAFEAGLDAAVQSPSEIHRFDVGYDAAYQVFTRDPSFNNAFNQALRAGYRWAAPTGFTASLRDQYVNTNDPPTSEQTGRFRNWRNAVTLDLEYAPEGGRLVLGLDGSHSAFKYVSDVPRLSALLNRTEQVFGGKAGYRLLPKTVVYAAYHRRLIHPTAGPATPPRDSRSHVASAGVEGDLAPKVTGSVEGGLTYRAYPDRVVRRFTSAARLSYRALEDLVIDGEAFRRFEEATFGVGRFYVATGASASARYRLPAGLGVAAGFGVERDEFGEGPRRRDVIYQARGALDYTLRGRYTLALGHVFRRRDSGGLTTGFGFRNGVTTLSATARF